MEQITKTDMQIKSKWQKEPFDPSALSDVIFVEDSDELNVISQIVLSGKYNREYKVVSYYAQLAPHNVCLDENENLLLMGVADYLVIVNIEQNKLLRVMDLNCWGILSVHKFRSGYFIHGEGINFFLNKNFDILWDSSCIDIFGNFKVENDIEVLEDRIIVYDWCGYMHCYTEHGERFHRYCPEYDCNKDGVTRSTKD